MNLTQSRQTNQAFAARDAIAIVGCLVVLALVQIPALGYPKGRSRLAQCLANHQQLSQAWLMYAEDNNARVVWNPDGGDAGKVASKPSWAGGWLDFTTNPDNTNIALLTAFSPPNSYGGLLGPYFQSPSIFRCPEDPTSVVILGARRARVRSVSMNSYLGGRRPTGSLNSWSLPPFRTFVTVNDFVRLKPAGVLLTIDEREDSINDAVFGLNLPNMLDGNDNPIAGGGWIVDYPADWHDGGATMSFADGHGEYWRWQDPRTTPTRSVGSVLPLNSASPDNPDILRLAKAASSH